MEALVSGSVSAGRDGRDRGEACSVLISRAAKASSDRGGAAGRQSPFAGSGGAGSPSASVATARCARDSRGEALTASGVQRLSVAASGRNDGDSTGGADGALWGCATAGGAVSPMGRRGGGAAAATSTAGATAGWHGSMTGAASLSSRSGTGSGIRPWTPAALLETWAGLATRQKPDTGPPHISVLSPSSGGASSAWAVGTHS